MKITFVLSVISILLFSCSEDRKEIKQPLTQHVTEVKPSYATIYDFCQSLKDYDLDGRKSLMESNARMFMARDKVSNIEKYIFTFRSGALHGNLEEAKKGFDIATSSYLGISSGVNTAFVPACVENISSSTYLQ
tara:strand:- start:193 stop:594 length:402 start_codon:yes stop_codon:yes gene_type:complete